MSKQIRQEKVHSYLKEFLTNELSVLLEHLDQPLEDIAIDSLERISIALEIEKHFSIRISDDLIDSWGKKNIEQISEQIYFLLPNE